MLSFRNKKASMDLLNFDWEAVLDQLNKSDPKSGEWFIIAINKGKEDEYRTRFMTYQETMELVILALEKKKLRIPFAL
jgi:hypothetical protein